MRSTKKWFLSFIMLLVLLSAPGTRRSVSAASKPVSITACKLSSADKIKITAKAKNTAKIGSQKCYLFALAFSQSGVTKQAKPLASVKTAKNMSFSVKLNNTQTATLLYSRFVVASKTKKGTYKVISNSRYISNPKKAAQYKYAFPAATSKKGLQVSVNMLEDAIDLNVQHSAMNIVFSDLLPTPAEQNNVFSIPWDYHGKTYWFRKALVNSYDAALTALKENDVVVSAILLLGWRDDLKYLIYPSGRKEGHSYYAWNTSNAAAREQLQATLAFLCSRYGSPDAEHGRIVNWIVGNEVNNYNVYNYAGKKSLAQYAKIYAEAFRMTYNTMTSIYSNARVYISLDHLWNTSVSGSFTSRKMLDKFASTLKKQGNIKWNLAFHAYGSPLTEPRFWDDINKQASDSLKTPAITMNNISVLTSYVKKKYGSSVRIILSEQGYTSVRHVTATDSKKKTNGSNQTSSKSKKTDAQKEQAAAIAYSYYLAESNSMIDAFILNRHVDHQAEIDQGLDLGLWTTDSSDDLPEWADEKKDSWEVFKYMDSNLAEDVTASARSVIGIKKWSEVIKGYSQSLYSKNTYNFSTPELVSDYQKSFDISPNWKTYGAVSGGFSGSGVFTAYHDSSRNRNSLWGFTQSFGQQMDLSATPYFYTALTLHGAAAGKAQITLRFSSGKQRILECSQTISCDTPVILAVSLANWPYKNAVKKIQVLVSPVKGKWAEDAYLTMGQAACGS